MKKDQIAERGARMARRNGCEYLEYLREEQRSQPGCPAREVVLLHRARPLTAYLTREAQPEMPERSARSRSLPALLALFGVGLVGPRYLNAGASQVAAPPAISRDTPSSPDERRPR